MRLLPTRTIVRLVIVGAAMVVLAAACGGSSPMTQGAVPPHVLASLPEGRLLVQAARSGPSYDREVFAVEGDKVSELAPAETAISANGKFIAYLEQTGDLPTAPTPTALVVRQTDGKEVFRLPLSAKRAVGPHWSPSDDRLALQAEQTIYVIQIGGTEQGQFRPPPGAQLASWFAGGSGLLLEDVPHVGDDDPKLHLFVMDPTSGSTFELSLPPDANLGGAGAAKNFSPDGKYFTYGIGICSSSCDLWVVELATGRSCLLMKDAPAHQYAQIPRWSPDSRWLTYYAKRDAARGYGDLHVVEADNCADQRIGSGDANSAFWSPDGSYLASTTWFTREGAEHVYVWHPGDPARSFEFTGWPLVWSGDSTALAVMTQSGLTLVDPESGATAEIPLTDPSQGRDAPIVLWSPSGRNLLVSWFLYEKMPLRPGVTPPPEKPLSMFTPSPGHAWMYILDRQTGGITTLVDEAREYAPVAWVP